MTQNEALRLALEALELANYKVADYCNGYTIEEVDEAITAIKKTLAQPEQEPVAFINVEQRKLEWAKYMSWDTPTVVNLPKIPLYTIPSQRTWVGLTDEEIEMVYAVTVKTHKKTKMPPTQLMFARTIQEYLKIKNT